MSPPYWRRCGVVLAIACLGASQSARAQATAGVPQPRVNAARVLESTLAGTPAAPEAVSAKAPRADDAPVGASEEGATLLVTGFRIAGNTVFADGELQPLLGAWVGKRLGSEQLLDASEAIRNRYKDAGYFLTQVFVPAQTPQDGTVTLRVVEARLGKARTRVDSQRVDAARVDAYMNMLPAGSAITEQAVQRPLLLLSDLPGVQVETTMSPGAEPGQADLLVDIKDAGHLVRADAYADNEGTPETGRMRLGAELLVDGALGIGDAWWLGGLVSQSGGVKAVRGAVSLPVGVYGSKVTLGVTHIDYRVLGSQFAALDANGHAEVATLDLRHPLVRSRNVNVFALAGATLLSVDDREFGGAVDDRRVLPIANFGLDGDFRDDLAGGAINTWGVKLDAGKNNLRTASQLAADQAPTGHQTSGQFQRLGAGYQRLQALTDNLSILASIRGHLAFQNLDASQKSSLGGPDGVRAFASGDGVGDDELQATLEFRQSIPEWSLWRAPVLLSAFVDGGRVRNWHRPNALDAPDATTLGGYGIGLNLSRRDDFQFRLDIARKINRRITFESDSGRMHGWASLTKSFR